MTELKNPGILKILLFLIPILVLSYLIYVNFLASHEFHYSYDIGSSESFLNPTDRISEPLTEKSTNYQNIINSPVYFDVPINKNSERVEVKIKFKNNFEDSNLILGVKDHPEWHYFWKTVYNPSLENFSSLKISNEIYKINSDLPNMDLDELIKKPGVIIGSTKEIVPIPQSVENNVKILNVSTALRGEHILYLYVNKTLEIKVKKQDLNWYNGSDELVILLYDSKNNLIDEKIIPDDKISTIKKGKSQVIEGNFILENLEPGVYKAILSDFDGIITEMSFNTDKVVIANKIYLANSNIFFSEFEKNSQVYTSFQKPGQISFRTWHSQSFQKIRVNDNILEIDKISDSVLLKLNEGLHEINSSKNDIIIEYPGYFSFTPESYFEPFINRVVPIQNNPSWIKNNLDYIISDYVSPVAEKDWLVSSVYFNLNDTYPVNNRLSFAINIPYLSSEANRGASVSIDWIDITVYKPGIFNKENEISP